MDPLSITVSTIALIELGLKIVKGLQILRDLSHVPDDIAALIDELHDLQDVLTAVCVATKHKASAAGLHQCSDELKSLLSKTGQTFRSIASHCGVLVEERHKPLQDDFVTAIESPSNVDLLTRFRWLKDRKRIDHYRRRLKILRLDINSHLASQNLWVEIQRLPKTPLTARQDQFLDGAHRASRFGRCIPKTKHRSLEPPRHHLSITTAREHALRTRPG